MLSLARFTRQGMRALRKTRFGKSVPFQYGERVRVRVLEWLGLRVVRRAHVSGITVYAPIEFHRLFESGYEPATIRLLETLVRPGMVLLDVGAHVGVYTLIASQLVGRKGHVYAFEPAPANFGLLRRNVWLNSATNVSALKVALTDRNGPVTFFLGRSSGWNSMARHPMNLGRSKRISVPGLRGDEALKQLGVEMVDVIKIDVEGAEVRVLRGLRETVERSRNCVVITELNPACLHAAGFSWDELVSELTLLGFTCRAIEEQTGDVREVTPRFIEAHLANDPYWYTNLLCTRRE